MQLRRITDPDSESFMHVWRIFLDSFPPDERRGLRGQKAVFGKKQFRLYSAHDGQALVGFVASWDFGDFAFLESFAVRAGLRNKGYGSRILGRYVRKAGKPVVLEVERPGGSEFAGRRIKFYERAGFRLNRYDYVQPPYGKNKRAVPMYLMTYGKKLGKAEFFGIRKALYSVVYNHLM
jgi:ribosomal protein S18 acetylase RimI-like enzyme